MSTIRYRHEVYADEMGYIVYNPFVVDRDAIAFIDDLCERWHWQHGAVRFSDYIALPTGKCVRYRGFYHERSPYKNAGL